MHRISFSNFIMTDIVVWSALSKCKMTLQLNLSSNIFNEISLSTYEQMHSQWLLFSIGIDANIFVFLSANMWNMILYYVCTQMNCWSLYYMRIHAQKSMANEHCITIARCRPFFSTGSKMIGNEDGIKSVLYFMFCG